MNLWARYGQRYEATYIVTAGIGLVHLRLRMFPQSITIDAYDRKQLQIKHFHLYIVQHKPLTITFKFYVFAYTSKINIRDLRIQI